MDQHSSTQATTDLAFHEKRRARRRRVLKAGTVTFNNGYGSYSCTVKNLTDQGAMIILEDARGLPEQFDFRLGDYQPMSASLVWKHEKQMGIAFVM